MTEQSAIYAGFVVHQRTGAIAHGFRYPMAMFLIDLDRVTTLDARSRLFGYNRRRIVSLRDRDHLGDPVRPLGENIRALLSASGMDEPIDRVLLLTQCRVFGYVFNPVSFFYCFGEGGALRTVVAEVHNTFGERHPYVLTRVGPRAPGHGPGEACVGLWAPGFGPGDRRVGPRALGHGPGEARIGPRASGFRPPEPPGGIRDSGLGIREWSVEKKVFHVSPFFDLSGHYRFEIDDPGERMTIRIDLHHEGHVRLATRLVLERRPWSDANILRLLARHPFMPHRVIAGIHWQALRLWRKGARYHAKPAYDPAAARGEASAESPP